MVFIPYQDLDGQFSDIDIIHFQQASRFIDQEGNIYSGPDSAYKSLSTSQKFRFLHQWYQKSSAFRALSDWLYQGIANNRNFFFRFTKFLFGSNPENLRPFWAVYLFVLIFLFFI